MTPLLEVEGVGVAFGDLEALRDVGFALAPATVTGLIGPNGAGKTTLLDVLSGFTAPDRGSVCLDGERLDPLAPHRRASRRLGRTFQSLELFDDMSVAENLRVAAETAGTGAAAAAAAATAVGLRADDDRLAADLSHGERKRLALARALTAQPRVLLLDEPAAGLDTGERHELAAIVRDVAAGGAAILLVDHDLQLVLDTCDRVVVLDFGRIIADGTPAAVRADPAVAAAYVGRQVTPATPAAAVPSAGDTTAALTVRGLTAGYGGAPVVRGIDLDVGAGEVVALLGPNGAGKTTTLLAVSGALRDTRGDVTVLGKPLHAGAYRQARAGVAHVLQSRRVFATLTVADNLRLTGGDRAATDEVLDLLPALRPLRRKQAGRLSGGEQQMLALARALVTRPRLLVIDELSLGLAPIVVTELLDTLAHLAHESSTAILLAEQHADLALRIATRGYVLVAGRIVDTGTAAELTAAPGRLAAAYLGAPAGPGGPTPLARGEGTGRPWTHDDETSGRPRRAGGGGRRRARRLRWRRR